ncbi:Putative Ig domain-containing protein [Sulfidibacter corallicola]|uniref:Putative Ig domain-containing protein n=1 Tax=Sulfidibacter corallicola TaxID=2818388 RepID=A0A8A4TSQ5_SULCO|nr:Ig domain-containing protein [Sulfidibacter corallicola]QTD52533.1 putative Ig domain-containing protein [Sulfidibacter corallicola]
MNARVNTQQAIDRREARRFWTQIQNNSFFSLYYMGHHAHFFDLYDTPEQMDRAIDELENFIRVELGCKTDWKTIVDEYESAMSEERLFWFGDYWLYDERGNHYVLRNRRDQVTLNERLDDVSFEDGTLGWENERSSGELAFSFEPDSDFDREDPEAWRDFLANGGIFESICTGTLSFPEGGDVQVVGRKNVFSREGATGATRGDDPAFWSGIYEILFFEDGHPVYPSKPMVFNGRGDRVFFSFDEVDLSESTVFSHNYLAWTHDGAEGELVLRRDHEGRHRLLGQLTRNGEVSHFVCFRRQGMGEAPRIAARRPLGARGHSLEPLAIGTTQDAFDGAPAKQLTTYQIELSAEGGTAPYAWSQGAGTLPDGLVLFPDGVIQGVVSENVAAGKYRFELVVTDAEEAKAGAYFELTVTENLGPLSILDQGPGNVFLDVQFEHHFQGIGGDSGHYLWSLTQSDNFTGNIDSASGIYVGQALQIGSQSLSLRLASDREEAKRSFAVNVLTNPHTVPTGTVILFVTTTAISVISSIVASVIALTDKRRRDADRADKQQWEDFKDFYRTAKENLREELSEMPQGEMSRVMDDLKELKKRFKRTRAAIGDAQALKRRLVEELREKRDGIIDRIFERYEEELEERRQELDRDPRRDENHEHHQDWLDEVERYNEDYDAREDWRDDTREEFDRAIDDLPEVPEVG